jgi:hypothetical protein
LLITKFGKLLEKVPTSFRASVCHMTNPRSRDGLEFKYVFRKKLSRVYCFGFNGILACVFGQQMNGPALLSLLTLKVLGRYFKLSSLCTP